jgi:hypothetical protein
MRLVFVKSAAAKERLKPALAEGNLAKTMAAPATIIVATDYAFYERMTRLYPAIAGARALFAGNESLAGATAFRNATLQGIGVKRLRKNNLAVNLHNSNIIQSIRPVLSCPLAA